MKKIFLIILTLSCLCFGQQNLADIPTNKTANVDSIYAWEFNRVVLYLQNVADSLSDAASLTGLGTVATGVWNGTSLADAYVDNDITASNYVLLTAVDDSVEANAYYPGGTDVADADVADDITVSNYVLLTAVDDSIATLVADSSLLTTTAGDAAYEAELDNSAGLLAALSDETGTGVAVFGTSPTITTSIDLPADAINSAGELGTDVVTMDAVDADGNFTTLTGNWRSTGEFSGGIQDTIVTDSLTIPTRFMYGGVIYVTGTALLTLPAVADGMNFSVITVGAVLVELKPDAADLFILDGTTLDDEDKAVNTSTTGDLAVVTYYNATGFYVASGSNDGDLWTDGS